MTFPLPSRTMLLIAGAAMLAPVAGAAQDPGSASSKTGATQITPRGTAGIAADKPDRRVFVDEVRPQQARPSPVWTEASQIARTDRATTASTQISATGNDTRQVPQLSRAELDATLAQLTPAERSVLLQAVEGTDICDRPPAVAAIITLCKTRIETKSGELDNRRDKPLTAEERLLRGGIESNGTPAVEAVIARLSRATGSSSTDDMSNQAIASVALTQSQGGTTPGKNDDKSGLSPGTDSVINAIVQQLGGQPGAVPPPSGGR